VLAFAPRGECIELGEQTADAVKVGPKVGSFLDGAAGRRNRTDQWHGVRVDGEVR
jgi:hypothetical protein